MARGQQGWRWRSPLMDSRLASPGQRQGALKAQDSSLARRAVGSAPETPQRPLSATTENVLTHQGSLEMLTRVRALAAVAAAAAAAAVP